MTYTDDSKYNELIEENEMAYFRADVCLGSPESFSLEEKAQICEEMNATNKAIEEAIRRDFEAMPPQFQDKLLDMLCTSGCMTLEWWRETLFGKMPDSPDELVGGNQSVGIRGGVAPWQHRQRRT